MVAVLDTGCGDHPWLPDGIVTRSPVVDGTALGLADTDTDPEARRRRLRSVRRRTRHLRGPRHLHRRDHPAGVPGSRHRVGPGRRQPRHPARGTFHVHRANTGEVDGHARCRGQVAGSMCSTFRWGTTTRPPMTSSSTARSASCWPSPARMDARWCARPETKRRIGPPSRPRCGTGPAPTSSSTSRRMPPPTSRWARSIRTGVVALFSNIGAWVHDLCPRCGGAEHISAAERGRAGRLPCRSARHAARDDRPRRLHRRIRAVERHVVRRAAMWRGDSRSRWSRSWRRRISRHRTARAR